MWRGYIMEPKFRAWVVLENGCAKDDPCYYKQKVMLDVSHLGFDEDGVRDVTVIDDICRDSEYIEYDIMDVVLMQWTGLQDKNGVDIYEKDIIKLDRTNCNEIGIKLHIDMVRRDKRGCYHVDDKRLHHCRLKKCEVVGNVFENPELLNVDGENLGE